VDPQELASTILRFISTPNLLNLVSTSYLDTQLASTVSGLGTSEYVSTQSLYSTVARWADYQATSAIILASTNAMIINPTPYDPVTEAYYSLLLQTAVAAIYDSNSAPGQLELGTVSFLNSTVNESYFLGNQSFFKGSVSSLALGRFSVDGALVSSMGSLFLSSVFLGNVGGSLVGEITTDATATDLFWKGSKLNSQAGSGVTLDALQSTVGGLGTASYVSTLTLDKSISSFSTALGPGGGGDGITTAQLISSTESWATYPAVSSIVFANDTTLTRNEIVSPGFTFFQLVNEIGVLATTSNTGNGVFPTRQFIGGSISITDQIDPLNPGNFNYNYFITAGASYTGTVSSLIVIDSLNSPAALYVSSLYLGDSNGLQFGSLESGLDYKNLFYNGSQLAYVSSLSGFISTPNLLNLVSTSYLDTQLASTVRGLGTSGYVSTSQLLSTSLGLYNQIQAAAASVSGSQLTSTTIGLGTLGYISSVSGVVSTPNLLNLVSTANLINLVSTANLLNLVSSQSLVSTTAGLGQIYLSSLPSILSTTVFLTSSIRVSSLISITLSTQQLFTSSIFGNTSQFQALSSQSLYVSSFFTATRQATPMFVTF